MTVLKLEMEFGLISGHPVFWDFPAEEGDMMTGARGRGAAQGPRGSSRVSLLAPWHSSCPSVSRPPGQCPSLSTTVHSWPALEKWTPRGE